MVEIASAASLLNMDKIFFPIVLLSTFPVIADENISDISKSKLSF